MKDGQPNDGYGFAVLRNHKWILYKTPCIPTTVENLRGENLMDNAIFSKPYSVIFGHLRYNNPSLKIGNKIEDNHPFLFQNQVFMHNGNIQDFRKHKTPIESWIDPKLRKHIKGHTDSERIFFLYITILRTLSKIIKSKQVYMFEALQFMMQLFKKGDIKFEGTLVYADTEYAVIFRNGPYSLYYDNITDTANFLVTRKNVTPIANNQMIPKNAAILINLKTKKKALYYLQL